MALDTWANLKTAIADRLKRTELTAIIPDFITEGEAWMNRKLRIPAMETTGTLTCVAGTATVSFSSLTRWRDFKWLYLDTSPKRPLSYVSTEQLYATYSGSTSGIPKVYTVEGSNLRLGPTPDSNYSIPCGYWSAFASLSGSVSSNALLASHPDLYLYASMRAATLYAEDDAEFKKYDKMAQLALLEVELEGKRQAFSGSVKQVRTDTGNPP
jgi:hypothetical protein